MTVILVVGVGHCGTTILRRIIGNHYKVYEVFKEDFPSVEHIYCQQVYLYKKPIYNEKLLSTLLVHLDSFKNKIIVIHISRNMKDVFSSLQKRFQAQQNFYDWNETLKVHTSMLLNDNILNISYENLISSPVNVIKQICDVCNLEYDENMIKFHENICTISNKGRCLDVPQNKPPDSEHDLLRIWQINQPLFKKKCI